MAQIPTVIGLGAGRCGTKSLATFLDAQGIAPCTHEAQGVMDDYDHHTVHDYLQAGNWDVSMAHLMYLWYYADLPDLRVIYIHRTSEKERWMKSLRSARHVEQSCHNRYPYTLYRHGLPKTVEEYVADYHRIMMDLIDTLNLTVLTIDVDMLNSNEGQASICRFLGIDEPVFGVYHEHQKNFTH